jgi:hypothetical protein
LNSDNELIKLTRGGEKALKSWLSGSLVAEETSELSDKLNEEGADLRSSVSPVSPAYHFQLLRDLIMGMETDLISLHP